MMTVTENEVRQLLKKHKGAFYGPRVEHLSIPEDDFWAFIDELQTLAVDRSAWDQVSDEHGGDHALRTVGPRP